MKKKAQFMILGIILFIIVMIVFGVINMFLFQSFDEIKPEIEEDMTSNESIDILNTSYNSFPSTFDNVLIVLFIGIWLFVLYLAYTYDEHPILFGFMIFVLIFVLIAGAMLSNSIEETLTEDGYTTLHTTFPISYFIITHILEVCLIIVFSIGLALYAKTKS